MTTVSPNDQLVSYSAYLKLKNKYDRVVKDKATLRKMLNNITESLSETQNTHSIIKSSIEAFQANLKSLSTSSSSPSLIQQSTNKHPPNFSLSSSSMKNYEAFSTSASFETLEPRVKQFLSISAKRIEELEICNRELTKKNETMEDLGNSLKKENEELRRRTCELEGKVKELGRVNEENWMEIEEKKRIIERTVEVGSCIENMYCNAIVLKCNRESNSASGRNEESTCRCSSRRNSGIVNNNNNNKSNNNNRVISAIGKGKNEKIICEPMPTFMKFLKHLK